MPLRQQKGSKISRPNSRNRISNIPCPRTQQRFQQAGANKLDPISGGQSQPQGSILDLTLCDGPLRRPTTLVPSQRRPAIKPRHSCGGRRYYCSSVK
ncbi:hypothetical protein EMCG_05760 [[Emmonsia] crescens]|uniref:Uncharacterized protein n=1 Tax=[Emmonsia] crescens TaxID=73230 RepID=A0A0G2IDD3_9EURO|nr:hypothetical protein EMCG_05760 [Emmonsia crescens UAMH 3008]